jgi:hypothetical protein
MTSDKQGRETGLAISERPPGRAEAKTPRMAIFAKPQKPPCETDWFHHDHDAAPLSIRFLTANARPGGFLCFNS